MHTKRKSDVLSTIKKPQKRSIEVPSLSQSSTQNSIKRANFRKEPEQRSKKLTKSFKELNFGLSDFKKFRKNSVIARLNKVKHFLSRVNLESQEMISKIPLKNQGLEIHHKRGKLIRTSKM